MPCRGLVTKQTYAVRSWTFINAEVALLFNYAVFKGVIFILITDFLEEVCRKLSGLF